MMNTTMAPVENIRQILGGLARRLDSLDDIRGPKINGRRRHMRVKERAFNNGFGGGDSGGGDVRDRINGDRRNRAGSNNNNAGSNDGSRFNFLNRNRGNNSPSAASPSAAQGTRKDKASERSPEISTTPLALPAESATLTSLGATPTIIFPLVEASSSFLTEALPPPTALADQLPSSLSLQPSPESNPNPEPAVMTGAPRKEVSATETGMLASASLTSNNVVTKTVSAIPQLGTELSATPVANTAFASSLPNNAKLPENMSALAERLLIAAGAIGAFVIIMAAIYVILRIQHIDPFSLKPIRKSRKSRYAAKYGLRKQSRQIINEAPPRYSEANGSHEKSVQEKIVPPRTLEASYSQNLVPDLAIPARVATSSSMNVGRHDLGQGLPPSTAERTGSSQSPNELVLASPAGLDTVQVKSGLLSHKVSDLEDYNNTGTQNTFLTRPISESYNLTGTHVTLLTRQTTNINDTDQREPNRVSQLSSLSSGFGDGLINTDGAPLTYNTVGRQSRPQRASRFSWQTSNGPRTPGIKQDRSSTLTTSSTESAPRFRSVGSWVAQQSGREERRQKKAVGVPSRPSMPAPLRIGQAHQRGHSEISAFKQHPGEEVELHLGTRVPSSILDGKLGHA